MAANAQFQIYGDIATTPIPRILDLGDDGDWLRRARLCRISQGERWKSSPIHCVMGPGGVLVNVKGTFHAENSGVCRRYCAARSDWRRALSAAIVDLTFEGVAASYPFSRTKINDFYNGGMSGAGTSGPDYGVTFSRGLNAACLNSLTVSSCDRVSKGGLGPVDSAGERARIQQHNSSLHGCRGRLHRGSSVQLRDHPSQGQHCPLERT